MDAQYSEKIPLCEVSKAPWANRSQVALRAESLVRGLIDRRASRGPNQEPFCRRPTKGHTPPRPAVTKPLMRWSQTTLLSCLILFNQT